MLSKLVKGGGNMSEELNFSPDQLKLIKETVFKKIKKDLKTETNSIDVDRGLLALTYERTENLVKHSITLTKLTSRLKWLTIILVGVAIVQIFFILATHFRWI